jgi:Rha family phage regulatory protein
MAQLKVLNWHGINAVDSREVAELTDIRHDNLIKKIKGYVQVLDSSNLRSQEFFLESTYLNSQNKEQPCYLLTRKGCDMVANKITGEKGVLFTAQYVSKFEELERAVKSKIDTTKLSPQLQMFNELFQVVANNELQNKLLQQEIQETKDELASVREVIVISPQDKWREETNRLVAKICNKLNNYKLPKEEIYRALQYRAKCDLKRRLENMRGRLHINGAPISKVNSLNFLDVVEEDPRLKEIYIAIVKEMSIKNGIRV